MLACNTEICAVRLELDLMRSYREIEAVPPSPPPATIRGLKHTGQARTAVAVSALLPLLVVLTALQTASRISFS